jgi:thiosulfate reductase cytochrome b subunit
METATKDLYSEEEKNNLSYTKPHKKIYLGILSILFPFFFPWGLLISYPCSVYALKNNDHNKIFAIIGLSLSVIYTFISINLFFY